MNDETSLKGAERIRAELRSAPGAPGVYRMLNERGEALYVGKARHLKNRLSSYTHLANLSQRIRRMVEQTASLELVVTQSEAEALLLEANLVKRLRPRYNILLRDDKSFPFIHLSEHAFPRIAKHRGPQTQKGSYFGPFASVGAVNETLAFLQRAFLLRPCSDSFFKNRTRPCLQYQIKRCSAPCVNRISEEEYAAQIEQGRQFLSGESRAIQERMAAQMQAASEAQDYETAAALRDRIRMLTQIQKEQSIHAPSVKEADIVALYREGEFACIQVFFFRHGQNFGNQSFFPAHTAESSDGEILAAFLAQFYSSHTPPPVLLLSHEAAEAELLVEALALQACHKVELLTPKRGEKQDILRQALENAKGALQRRMSEAATQRQLLEGVAALFGLPVPPQRIEVYDNSHIMGTHAVGGMIVAGPEGFMKKAYRRFTIKTAETDDDYAMLREVLTRRLSRALEEDPDRSGGQWPDLLLIDGGAGQLSATAQAMETLGITGLPFVAIAKGPERNAGREQFFLPNRTPFQLPPHDPVLHYLQRLRDEAHRFAIGSHRIKRSNAIRQSELDDIPGIGAGRKKALLQHFGSARGVKEATLAELKAVPGIHDAVARLIHGHFHQ